jgi:hypothetical protein
LYANFIMKYGYNMFKPLRSVFVFFVVLCFLIGCSKTEKSNNISKFYILNSEERPSTDSVPFLNVPQFDSLDLFLAANNFVYNGVKHKICAYTSVNHAPVDGGRSYYLLDSVGIIYLKSTTWPISMRLSSNNDSLNDLISQAYSNILLKPLIYNFRLK